MNLLCTKDAARRLGLSPRTLEAMRFKGKGPAFIRLPNGRARYSDEDLQAWARGERA